MNYGTIADDARQFAARLPNADTDAERQNNAQNLAHPRPSLARYWNEEAAKQDAQTFAQTLKGKK